MKNKKHLIALLTNDDDDIYCFRKELIEEIINAGYEMLISCPNGEKFDLMKHIEYRYDDPVIDRRGTEVAPTARNACVEPQKEIGRISGRAIAIQAVAHSSFFILHLIELWT